MMAVKMSGEDVTTALHRFGLARDRLSAALSQATGSTATELEALEHLEEDGPLTQRELAERLFLTSGGTTLLVDRLERRGLVRRRPHPDDRRAVLVELGPAAAEATPLPLERYHASLAAAARRMSAGERQAVVAFLSAAAAAEVEAAEALRTDLARRHERRGGRTAAVRPREKMEAVAL
jgi:DNA-binding MarR family transcriptional regulator